MMISLFVVFCCWRWQQICGEIHFWNQTKPISLQSRLPEAQRTTLAVKAKMRSECVRRKRERERERVSVKCNLLNNDIIFAFSRSLCVCACQCVGVRKREIVCVWGRELASQVICKIQPSIQSCRGCNSLRSWSWPTAWLRWPRLDFLLISFSEVGPYLILSLSKFCEKEKNDLISAKIFAHPFIMI